MILLTNAEKALRGKAFVELVEFFNKLERDLEYPNSENAEDRAEVLRKANQELIMWGKL